jgi:hypothetical protein
MVAAEFFILMNLGLFTGFNDPVELQNAVANNPITQPF